MAQIIYRDDADKLQIGTDSKSEQMSTVVYRSQADKEIVERDGVFVEVNRDGSGERMLFSK